MLRSVQKSPFHKVTNLALHRRRSSPTRNVSMFLCSLEVSAARQSSQPYHAMSPPPLAGRPGADPRRHLDLPALAGARHPGGGGRRCQGRHYVCGPGSAMSSTSLSLTVLQNPQHSPRLSSKVNNTLLDCPPQSTTLSEVGCTGPKV